MATMFLRFRVADYAKWKPVFDEREGARRESGFTAHGLHRDADEPNVIILAFRVRDLGRAREYAASDALRSAMEQAGVQGSPEFWFAEDIEDKRYG